MQPVTNPYTSHLGRRKESVQESVHPQPGRRQGPDQCRGDIDLQELLCGLHHRRPCCDGWKQDSGLCVCDSLPHPLVINIPEHWTRYTDNSFVLYT